MFSGQKNSKILVNGRLLNKRPKDQLCGKLEITQFPIFYYFISSINIYQTMCEFNFRKSRTANSHGFDLLHNLRVYFATFNRFVNRKVFRKLYQNDTRQTVSIAHSLDE